MGAIMMASIIIFRQITIIAISILVLVLFWPIFVRHPDKMRLLSTFSKRYSKAVLPGLAEPLFCINKPVNS